MVKNLELGGYPGLSRGSSIITRVLKCRRGESERERHNFGRTITDVMLLALMLKKGLRAKEYVWPLKAVGKGKEWIVPWSLQKGMQPLHTHVGLLTSRTVRS